MYLQLAYIDPETHAIYPQAALTISNVRLQLDPPAAELDLALYVSANALNSNVRPFERRNAAPLTPAEITSLRSQFAAAVYQVLLARPEFQAAQVVP